MIKLFWALAFPYLISTFVSCSESGQFSSSTAGNPNQSKGGELPAETSPQPVVEEDLASANASPEDDAEAASAKERGCTNVAVSLVIDNSGSMGDEDPSSILNRIFPRPNQQQPGQENPDDKPSRMEVVQGATKEFLNKLVPKDKVGLVNFNSNARIRENLTEDHDRVQQEVENLNPRGNTNIVEGLLLGAELLQEETLKDTQKVLFLLSDGEHTEEGNPVGTAQEIKDKYPDIKIITMGYELSQQGKAILQSVADSPSAYFDAEDGEAVVKAFQTLGDQICRI